jgi:signal transduction histidine kinase
MPLTAVHELSVGCRLGRDPRQVGQARRLVRETLPGWGLGGQVALAELIVSELVTNALWHGDGPIDVRLSYAGGSLRVEVHDDGDGRPVRHQATADDEGGRGLELLDGLIALHGGGRGVVDDGGTGGKTVYVAVTLHPAVPLRS